MRMLFLFLTYALEPEDGEHHVSDTSNLFDVIHFGQLQINLHASFGTQSDR